MEFRCIEECSQCCIEREYYPSKEFGKIGVLILPEEKERIERLGKTSGLEIKIIPRIGISENEDEIPTKNFGISINGNKKKMEIHVLSWTQKVEISHHMGDFHVEYTKRDHLLV